MIDMLDEDIDQFLSLSRLYGGDPAFCIAGGGNTSCKTDSRLFIKASGHALANLGPEGLVEMDRTALRSILNADWPTNPDDREALFSERLMAARVYPELGQRPSVETLIHELIPRKFVVHTHATKVNALTCCVDGRATCNQWFGEDVLWLPYCDPGITLAMQLQEILGGTLAQSDGPVIIFMENHGLIVAADSEQAIRESTQGLIQTIDAKLDAASRTFFPGDRFQPCPNNIAAWEHAAREIAPDRAVLSQTAGVIAELVSTTGGRNTALLGPLTPDHIVYCRSLPLWIGPDELDGEDKKSALKQSFNAYEQTHGTSPWVALIAGCGMLAIRETIPLAEITCAAYSDAAEISRLANYIGQVQALSLRDRAFIENWEVESYRRAVVKEHAT